VKKPSSSSPSSANISLALIRFVILSSDGFGASLISERLGREATGGSDEISLSGAWTASV